MQFESLHRLSIMGYEPLVNPRRLARAKVYCFRLNVNISKYIIVLRNMAFIARFVQLKTEKSL